MSLDLDIQALLRSPQVQEINFNMRGIRVTGAGFRMLASHFSDNPIPQRIRVTIDPHRLPSHTLAGYFPAEDRIVVRSNMVLSTLFGRQVVIHECTHAQIDHRGRSTAIRSEEGAACIAGAWYMIAAGASEGTIDAAFGHRSSIRLLTNLIRRRSLAAGGIVDVTASEINTVRRFTRRFYPNRHYTDADGIGGHIDRGE
jgi:hypothetical protein